MRVTYALADGPANAIPEEVARGFVVRLASRSSRWVSVVVAFEVGSLSFVADAEEADAHSKRRMITIMIIRRRNRGQGGRRSRVDEIATYYFPQHFADSALASSCQLYDSIIFRLRYSLTFLLLQKSNHTKSKRAKPRSTGRKHTKKRPISHHPPPTWSGPRSPSPLPHPTPPSSPSTGTA